MDSQQKELLTKMLGFYKKKNKAEAEWTSKFMKAARDLVNTGDITKLELMAFCYDNDVDPSEETSGITPKKKSVEKDPLKKKKKKQQEEDVIVQRVVKR